MKKKSLFTFVVEFRKGTYVSQVRSTGVSEALRNWADKVDTKTIKNLDVKTLSFIREQVSSREFDKPTKIAGIRNTWFTILLTKKGAFYISIVKTA